MSKSKKILDRKWFLYDFIKWTSVPLSQLFFRHKKIYASGKKDKKLLDGRLIICSNHVSLEDAAGIITCLWQRRISFMINKNLVETHKAKHFFRGVGCIPVDRDNFDIDSIKKAIQTIDEGHTIGFFPEGRINTSQELLPFKSGVVMTAFLANADILPIYISKRKNKSNRWVVILGERIKVVDLIKNQYPTINEINDITKYVNQKETELKQIYIDKWVNRKVK